MKAAVDTIQASQFKARCLQLMDEVARTGKPLLITKHGRPVAELQPVQRARAPSLIGSDKGRIRILGDIVSPLDTDDWDALR